MSRQITTSRAVRLLSAGALCLLTSPGLAQLETSGTSQYPVLFVEDSSPTPIPLGQVVGFSGLRPLVVIEDASGDEVLLQVRKHNLATQARVFFSNNNCTGTAYLPTFVEGTQADLAGTFEELQGTAWGIGPPTSGSIGVLYKQSGTLVLSASIQSAWISVNNPPNCFASTAGSGETKFGTTAQDLDALFTPPFKLRD